MTRTGLTLLEVLVATAILSSVVATGALILRDASSAAKSSDDLVAARSALNQYVLTNEKSQPDEPWEWVDDKGTQWRITEVVLKSYVDVESESSASGAHDDMLHTDVVELRVQRVSHHEQKDVLRILRLRELTAPELTRNGQ